MTFFSKLFTNLPSKTMIVISAFPIGKSKAFSVDEIIADKHLPWVEQYVDNNNIYFSCCAHDPELLRKLHTIKPNSRGNAETVSAIPSVWLDLDVGKIGHAEHNLPTSAEEALKIVTDNFPLKPSIVVATGGGLHLYWVLKEPIEITCQRERKAAQNFLNRLHDHMKNIFDNAGYHLDKVSDLGRVLRLPSTFNLKDNQKRPVVMQECTDKQFNISEIEDIIGIPTVEAEPVDDTSVYQSTYNNSYPKNEIPYTVAEICECDFIEHCYEKQKYITEPLWYACITNIARLDPNGEELCHELSHDYLNYTVCETDEKIRHALEDAPGPFTCLAIADLGSTCPSACSVKAPVVLLQQKKRAANKTSSSSIDESSTSLGFSKDSELAKLKIPHGYCVRYGSLYRVIKKDSKPDSITLICHHPIAISRAIRDIGTGIERREITFQKGNRINRVVIERALMVSRGNLELANKGISVTTTTSASLANYLVAFEHCNYELIPEVTGVSQLGWVKINSELKFIFGCHIISKNGIELIADSKDILLNCPDATTELKFKGFSIKGKISKSIELLKNIKSFPRVIIIISTTLASPLLSIFTIEGKVVHFGHRTSTGKTSGLKIGASMVGDFKKIIATWDQTVVSVERLSGFYHHLPIFLDDTNRMSSKNRDNGAVESIVYQHCSGTARGRGTLKGLQESLQWCSCMLSTGEGPLIDHSNEGGVRARVLDIRGIPFNKISDEIGLLVRELEAIAAENYGHVGTEFILYILENYDCLDAWKAELEEIKKILLNTLSAGVGSRLAEFVALLIWVANKLNLVFALEWDLFEMINLLIRSANSSCKDVSPSERALEDVYGWFCSNITPTENSASPKKTKGSKKKEKTVKFTSFGYLSSNRLAIIPQNLQAFLKKAGYAKSVIKTWKDFGWLDCNKGRVDKNISFQNNQIRMICINKKGLSFLQLDEADSSGLYDEEADLIVEVSINIIGFLKTTNKRS